VAQKDKISTEIDGDDEAGAGQPATADVGRYKASYITLFLEEFKFLDPECHDGRVREVNMRSKKCNRCLGLEECKLHPLFWLAGEAERLALNNRLPEDIEEARKIAKVADYQRIVKRERYDLPDEVG